MLNKGFDYYLVIDNIILKIKFKRRKNMIDIYKNIYDNKLFEELKIDCKKCFGFCCVVFYFFVLDGFFIDKELGKFCINL